MGFALCCKAVVEDLVEAFGFGLVAVYCVGDFFGGVWDGLGEFSGFRLRGRFGVRTSEEVVCLALHGADATLL